MPGEWTNRQTGLIWDWLQERPRLLEIIRWTAAAGDTEALRQHIVDYYYPVPPDRPVRCEARKDAVGVADWPQLRSRILSPPDGAST